MKATHGKYQGNVLDHQSIVTHYDGSIAGFNLKIDFEISENISEMYQKTSNEYRFYVDRKTKDWTVSAIVGITTTDIESALLSSRCRCVFFTILSRIIPVNTRFLPRR